jgi:hypothetical protein
LILIILLVDKLTGDIKEKFGCEDDNAVNISQCIERLEITEPMWKDAFNKTFCKNKHCPITEPPQ